MRTRKEKIYNLDNQAQNIEFIAHTHTYLDRLARNAAYALHHTVPAPPHRGQ